MYYWSFEDDDILFVIDFQLANLFFIHNLVLPWSKPQNQAEKELLFVDLERIVT